MDVVDMISAVAGRWGWWVWHVTWQASLVAVVLVLIARLGRRRSARLAYGLLVLALVKFAVFPTFSLSTGLFSHLAPAVAGPAEATAPRWLIYLMALHLLGVCLAAGWAAIQVVRLACLTRSAEPVTAGPVYKHLSYMARKMGLRRSVRLLACRRDAAPMAFGVLTPSVLVPASMLEDLPPRQVATVLAHELAHHRRGDLWINWLQVALAVLWWFNPVIWLVNRSIRRMREDCCDDLLLQEEFATDDGYCQTLLAVAARMAARTRLLSGVPRFTDRLGPLGERIVRIMEGDRPRGSAWALLRPPALALLALLLLPGLTLQSTMPPLPSRTANAPVAAAGAGVETAAFSPSAQPAGARRSSLPAAGAGHGLFQNGIPADRVLRLGGLSIPELPGDTTVATEGRPMLAPTAMAGPAPALTEGYAIGRPVYHPRPLISIRPTDDTRPFGSLDVARPTAPGQKAMDLIDPLADARSGARTSNAEADKDRSPSAADDTQVTLPKGDGLAQAVKPDPIDQPIIPVEPAEPALVPYLTDSRFAGLPVVSTRIDPKDASGKAGTGDPGDADGFVPSPVVPEPASLTLLAAAAVFKLRRRR